MNRKHFQEHKKLRISSSDKSIFKHEVCKLACIMIVNRKYKSKKIYSEFPVGKRIADVYFTIKEGKKDKEYCVEIQKVYNKKYHQLAEEFYLDRDIQPIIIPLKEIPETLDEIWQEIEKRI